MKLTRLNELVEDGKVIQGRWELTPHHELRYRSDGRDETLGIKGALIAAEPDALVISVTERQKDQKIATSTVKLAGKWRLDPKNRIVFEVQKARGAGDALTFKGGWQVGKSNEIVYTYDQKDLKTKRRRTHRIAFSGHWGISRDNRLTYFLGADSDSAFSFRGAFETAGVRAKKGEIRYQAGVEINGRRQAKTIVLFGTWKVSHDFDVAFEIEYGGGRKRAITFTKGIFGRDGQAFLRLEKSARESMAEAGMKVSW